MDFVENILAVHASGPVQIRGGQRQREIDPVDFAQLPEVVVGECGTNAVRCIDPHGTGAEVADVPGVDETRTGSTNCVQAIWTRVARPAGVEKAYQGDRVIDP